MQKHAETLKAEMQKHMEELQAKGASEANAAKLKADEIAARRDEAMARVKLDEKKLTEEFNIRRAELENQQQKTQADIRKIEAEIKKLESEAGVAEIKEIMGEVPEEQPQPTDVDKADAKSKMATAQTTLIEQQIKYVELQQRLEALKEMQNTAYGSEGDEGDEGDEGHESSEELEEPPTNEIMRDEAGNLTGLKSETKVKPKPRSSIALPNDLGSPDFGRRKKRTKMHRILRGPDGNIMGVKTDEVEEDDDEAPIETENLGAGPPKPSAEAAPGVQMNGLPTPPSEMAAVDPNKPIGAIE